MNLALVRVDDRLIHGQVVLGCCGTLSAGRLILCDDDVANDPLQRRIYASAAPPSIEVEILDRSETLRRLGELEAEGDPLATVLVVGRPADALWLVRAGAPLDAVNIGGLHYREGTEEVWPGFYLTPEDREDLRALLSLGVGIVVQTVPGAPSTDASEALLSPGPSRTSRP
jgi:mannose/fructose/N-acetylgalactosamine-specific phosphotransferase system component IIB